MPAPIEETMAKAICFLYFKMFVNSGVPISHTHLYSNRLIVTQIFPQDFYCIFTKEPCVESPSITSQSMSSLPLYKLLETQI